jgi:hypothetical protein
VFQDIPPPDDSYFPQTRLKPCKRQLDSSDSCGRGTALLGSSGRPYCRFKPLSKRCFKIYHHPTTATFPRHASNPTSDNSTSSDSCGRGTALLGSNGRPYCRLNPLNPNGISRYTTTRRQLLSPDTPQTLQATTRLLGQLRPWNCLAWIQWKTLLPIKPMYPDGI